jgi:hypothetical protein
LYLQNAFRYRLPPEKKGVLFFMKIYFFIDQKIKTCNIGLFLTKERLSISFLLISNISGTYFAYIFNLMTIQRYGYTNSLKIPRLWYFFLMDSIFCRYDKIVSHPPPYKFCRIFLLVCVKCRKFHVHLSLVSQSAKWDFVLLETNKKKVPLIYIYIS